MISPIIFPGNSCKISSTLMQAIKAESAKQTAALQEESRKQTGLLKAESDKLTSAVENLRSEIRRENEKLAKSLIAKFETAYDRIKEDFEVRLNSEIHSVSERIEDVRKENEIEVIKLIATIDEVYASVSEKVNTDVTQAREAVAQIKEYVDDKFRTVSGDVQQVRRNADEISKVNATLGELQHKLASGIPNDPQSADLGNSSVRVNRSADSVSQ
jgi:ribosome-associated toxin RatA of RatAB toxin-antitoxin module